MALKHIKGINEFFDSGVFGDTYGYGGSNGVFKVSYKPYSDLSVTVGPDPDIPRNTPGSQFQVGDIVIGVPVDEKDKKVAGMIVRVEKDNDNKGYEYYVQVTSKKSDGEKVTKLKPDTVEFLDMGDKGHRQVASQYKFSDVASKAWNSKSVYKSSELGIEQIGG